MKQKDARFLPPVLQQEIRRTAMDMFLKGVSQINISKTLGVSTRSIYKWVKTYKKLGEKGLEIHKRGRPKGTQLQPWQCAQIVNLIKNYKPDELSMPFFLWTRESVSMLILNKFNISISKWTV